MKALYTFLFPLKPSDTGISLLLLFVRIAFGLLLLAHGMQKWNNFETLSAHFPDPLQLGSPVSLTLAIFGELVCSLGFVFGVLYRLALIPMIFTMCIAFFVVHRADAWHAKELALVYLLVFVVMYMAGPGKFSIDYHLAQKLRR